MVGAVVAGVCWRLAAGALREPLESLASTCTTTPHPPPAPACPIQMELVLTRLQRPWKRADERSCAPTPRACEAGRGYSRIKWAAAGAARAGAGLTLAALRMGLWGEVKFLAPAAGDTVSPQRTQCRAAGLGSRADFPTAPTIPCWDSLDDWILHFCQHVRVKGDRVLFALAALGHGAAPLCPGVPHSQPSLPWDKPQLWKSGSKIGKCFPAGNFPQGQPGQADREFPILLLFILLFLFIPLLLHVS